jgi:hypothetical protein
MAELRTRLPNGKKRATVRLVPEEFFTHTHITAAGQAEPHEPVADVPRAPIPKGPPPVPGAQWDEVHRRWEHFDEASQSWVVVGDVGDGVDPADENPLPRLIEVALHRADELDADTEDDRDPERIIDVPRAPEPPTHVPGAQWNEVTGVWERWSDTAGAWVPVEPEPPAAS